MGDVSVFVKKVLHDFNDSSSEDTGFVIDFFCEVVWVDCVDDLGKEDSFKCGCLCK